MCTIISTPKQVLTKDYFGRVISQSLSFTFSFLLFVRWKNNNPTDSKVRNWKSFIVIGLWLHTDTPLIQCHLIHKIHDWRGHSPGPPAFVFATLKLYKYN